MIQFSISSYQQDFEHLFKRIGSSSEAIAKYRELPELEIDFEVYLPTFGINLQRKLVWTLTQKQEFILSIFKNIYLPPVSLIIDDTNIDKVYQVIDGKQRITTIISYLNNEFPVNVNKNNYYYSDLDKSSRIYFGNKHLKGHILYTSLNIDPLTDKDKIKWFEYINFTATPQDQTHKQKLLNLIN